MRRETCRNHEAGKAGFAPEAVGFASGDYSNSCIAGIALWSLICNAEIGPREGSWKFIQSTNEFGNSARK